MRVAIEGNIGCGKTTLCSALASRTRLPVVLEPLREWADILERFYKDPGRWGFAMNVNVLASYAMWARDERDIIFERSPYSCRWVFSEQQVADGHMDGVELAIIDQLHRGAAWKPDVVIYLRCPPDTCHARMVARGRGCEDGVSAGYLRSLHVRYEAAIEALSRDPHVDVFCVDAGAPTSEVLDAVARYLDARLAPPPPQH